MPENPQDGYRAGFDGGAPDPVPPPTACLMLRVDSSRSRTASLTARCARLRAALSTTLGRRRSTSLSAASRDTYLGDRVPESGRPTVGARIGR